MLLCGNSIIAGIVPLDGLQEFGAMGIFKAGLDAPFGGTMVVELMDSG